MKNFFLITGAYGNILDVQPKAFPGRLYPQFTDFRFARSLRFELNRYGKNHSSF